MTKAFAIKGYPDYYVTDTGIVYSRKSGRFKRLAQTDDGHGYAKVSLCNNTKPKVVKVHRLVAQAFIPNPENKPQINHKNGVRNDNRVENLEWCTNGENSKHSYECLNHKKIWKGLFGKDNMHSKPVLQIKDNIIIKEFGSACEAARETNLSFGNICSCCRGERKQTGGFQWKYKTNKNKEVVK